MPSAWRRSAARRGEVVRDGTIAVRDDPDDARALGAHGRAAGSAASDRRRGSAGGAPRCTYARNSRLPSAPVIGAATIPTTGKPRRRQSRRDALEHLAVDLRVANDPTLAHRATPGLELGLHEQDEPRIGECAACERRRHREQRDEREICDRERHRAPDGVRFEMPDVGALQRRDARVGAQRPRELPSADVDRDDLRGTSLEQAVGEASGRRSGIEDPQPTRLQAEGRERRLELLAPARHVAAGLAPHGDRLVGRRRGAPDSPWGRRRRGRGPR